MHCLATPAAVEHFLDPPALTALTGHPVRSTYRTPDTGPLPRADAVIVAPATYNTINKWAAGIADNYVLNQLAELTGLGARIVVLPFVNQGLAANQVFLRNIEQLRQARRAGPVRARRVRATPAAHRRRRARHLPVGSRPDRCTEVAQASRRAQVPLSAIFRPKLRAAAPLQQIHMPSRGTAEGR